MVKAAITPFVTRESLIPSDRQLVRSSHTNNIQQQEKEEEFKRTYLLQNKILAKKNEDLQIKVRNLENQLFETQKNVLSLKSEKIQLTEKLKLNSKRFNDIIIDSFDNLMNQYRSFMADIGIDIEKKDIPTNLLTKVNENNSKQNANIDFAHYWQNINEDLQRRKSCIFQNKDIDLTDIGAKETGDDDQLDTLVEKIGEEEEEEEEKVLEPEYEDHVSTNIPIKRQSIIMKKLDNCKLTTNVPYLGIPKDNNIKDTGNNDNNDTSDNNNHNDTIKVNEIDNNNDELFNYIEEEPPRSPTKPNYIELDDKNYSNHDTKEPEENEERKIVRRKSKVPRELKNLDTEKTKKWLGMDPLDDVEESTSERRKSRRRSLVVNYQLPSLKQKMRRSSGLYKGKIYIDDDKENRVSKPKNKANKNILRNITNIHNNTNSINNKHNRKKEEKEKSIFDLENDDIFTRYDSNQRRNSINTNRDEVYDLLL